jgi:hypothetical protein
MLEIRKTALAFYVGLSVWAALSYLAPPVFFVLSIFTLGLSLLFPTIWLYATLLLPVILLKSNKTLPLVLKAASILLTVFVSYGPAQIENEKVEQAVQELVKDDFIKSATKKHQHILLDDKYAYFDTKMKNPLHNVLCNKYCQRYLLNGDISTVTIKSTHQYNHSKTAEAVYALEKRERCPNIWSGMDDPIIDVALKSLEGICVVHLPNVQFTEGLIVEVQRLDLDKEIFVRRVEAPWANRVFVKERIGGTDKLLAQVTTISYVKASGVLTVSPYGSFLSTVSGWEVGGGTTEVKNTETPEEFIEKFYGIKATPPKRKDGTPGFDISSFNVIQPETALIKTALSDQSPLPFGQLRIEAIGGWMERLPGKWKNKSPSLREEDQSVLKQIIVDHRINDLSRGYTAIRQLLKAEPNTGELVAKRFCRLLDIQAWPVRIDPLAVMLKEHSSGSLEDFPRIQESKEITAQAKLEYCK